jgi:hypothetical protein
MAGIQADANRLLAQQVVDLYNNAENAILEKMAKRLASGVDQPKWEHDKLLQIQQMRDDVKDQIARLDLEMPKEVNGIVKKAYTAGKDSVTEDLIKQGLAIVDKDGNLRYTAINTNEYAIKPFGKVDQFKVDAIAKAMQGQLKDAHPQVLRDSEDIYKKVITEAVTQQAVGSVTMRQAVQYSLSRFAMKGVAGFVDKAGRNWKLSSYAEMACRSGLVQANLAGTQDRMTELGIDLVIVSMHSASSPLCLPWEGKVLKNE